MNATRHAQVRRLADSAHFKHFLWRRHDQARALHGILPEVLATDGKLIRRMMCQPKQIVFQQFQDVATAQALIERIESSITPGVALVGYALYESHEALAILNAGSHEQPGWLAFPDAKIARAITSHLSATLPLHAAQLPKLRLVAGATLAWERRNLVLRAALEQRGSAFHVTPEAFDILEHLTAWRIEAIIHQGGVRQSMDLTEGITLSEVKRLSAHRVEASFVIEPMIYRELRSSDSQIWFHLSFDRDLFCLPDEWSAFWLLVDVVEPAGMFM